jgi:hypothetical protein
MDSLADPPCEEARRLKSPELHRPRP